MNGRCIYSFAALAIALAWASASACLAEDIYSPQTPLKVLDLVPNPRWEKEKRDERASKFYWKADELKKLGKYTDADYFFRLALQHNPELRSEVNWQQAEIFDRLGRKEDADRLMRKVVEGKKYDFWIAEKYIRYLIKEHRGNEAVVVCHKTPYLLKREDGVILLAESLIAADRKSDAIALAKRYYNRMEREETTYGGFKAFLEDNGVRCEPKYSSAYNKAVLSIIKRISSLKKPVTDSQLAALFPQQDKDKKWLRYNSGARCTICRSNFWQIRIYDEEPNSSRIKIYPDRHKTCITRAEVEKLFGKTVMKPATWAMHGNGRPERFEYFDRDPNLRFFFSSTQTMFPPTNEKIQRVTEVQIAWKDGRIPEPPPTPYVPPKSVPAEVIDGHISEAEDAYLKGDYRRAATLLMKFWQEEGIRTDRIGFKRYSRRKKVLLGCYEKLGRNDIAEYIRMADCMSLTVDVDQAFGNRTLLLPTLDEYMRRAWKVQDGGVDGQMSFYSVWPITTVDKNTPRYEEFYKAVGPFNSRVEIEILPLPASLVDPAIFEKGAADS